MKTTILLLALITSVLTSKAQSELWHLTDTTGGAYGPAYLAHDIANNIYTGTYAGNQLHKVRKVSPSGTLLWERAIPVIRPYNSKMVTTLNGDTYLAGQMSDSAGILSFGYRLKFNSSGALEWLVQNDSLLTDDFSLEGADIFISGKLNLPDSVYNGGTVSEVDAATGALLWSKRIQFAGWYKSRITVTSDHMPLLAALGASAYGFFLQKLDRTGAQLSSSMLSISTTPNAPLFLLADSFGQAFLAYGIDSMSGNYFSSHIGVMQITQSASVNWSVVLGDSSVNSIYSAAIDRSANIYIGGLQGFLPLLARTSIMAKLDGLGNVQWKKVQPDTTALWDELIVKKNIVYAAGGAFTIYKYDLAGNLLGTIQDANGVSSWLVDLDEDENIIAGGISSAVGGTNGYGNFMAKFGLNDGIQHIVEPTSVSIFPNPVTKEHVLQIVTSDPLTGNAYLMEITGRKVLEINNEGRTNYMYIPASVSSGMYLLEVQSEDQVLTKKIIVE